MALIEMSELDVRMSERLDELKWLYYELYYSDEQGFQYLCKLIRDFYENRSESLKALEALVNKAGGEIVGKAAVLAEGDAADRDDIIFLEKLPVFPK